MNTITCNKKMISLLLSYRNQKMALSDGLSEIIHDGLIIRNKCLLFKNLYKANNGHIKPYQFEDLTAYETFINGFSINDFCSNHYLRNGLLFLDELSNIIENRYPNTPMELILCKSSRMVHFTMHTIRSTDSPYLDCDLEVYSEPTIVYRHSPSVSR